MKNNKKLYLVILLAVIVSIVFLAYIRYGRHKQQEKPLAQPVIGSKQIEYWTCSMHPQVHKSQPGKCPICGMELIPVYKQDVGKIIIDKAVKERLGIRSHPAEYRHLTKIIRLPARVSHDYELYSLQQEYLSVLASLERLKESAAKEIFKRQEALLKATRLRLKLLGLSDEQIAELENKESPDESFIYPEQGRVWIQADIYEQDISKIQSGQTVRAKIKGYEEEAFSGKVYSVEKVLSLQTRSAKARIEIIDPDNMLRHEMYADLTLEIDLGSRLSIPYSSLIDTGTRKVVYLDLGEGRYQMTQVKTGVEAQGYVEILEGLKEADLVVTDGNFLLDSQTTLSGTQPLLYGVNEEVKEKLKAPIHKH